MMGFGFVVARFGLFLREIAEVGHTTPPASVGLSLWVGTALLLLGVVATLTAAVQHVRFLRRLSRGEPYRAPRWSLSVVVAVLLGSAGIAMTFYLLLLHP
jgi:putative membrane protein